VLKGGRFLENLLFSFTFFIILGKLIIGDKMQRYFITEKQNNNVTFSKEDSYHIKTVMRMTIEDKVEVVLNEKIYEVKLISMEPNVLGEIVKEIEYQSELKTKVTLVQSLVKEQKMDYILQKATELGVEEIIPYQAERSIIKIEKNESKKVERWNRIVKEASEQSKRNKIPTVRESITLKQLLELENYDVKVICSLQENSQNLKKILSNFRNDVTMLFVIGPEGGFTQDEENKLIEHGFLPVSLGDSVLRTETAGLFIMSAIRYHNMG